jgi:3-hydroxyacyl-CoA dehydrogenase
MGIAYLQAYLVNLREAGQISDHRYEVGCKIAQVLCGGSVESNTWVDEAWMNQLACEAFMELAKQERTHHLLQRYVKTQLFTSF